MTSTPIKHTVNVMVNGKAYQAEVPTYRMLVDMLRYDLGFTGTKETCSVGVCGACTIMLDGKMSSSCITLAVRADGADNQTIEGVADCDKLHPVQEAFIANGGFQCGACTPGQIMAAKSLLEEIPHPTEAQIKEWMMGNLCRCTGYYQIIDSIKAAAEAK